MFYDPAAFAFTSHLEREWEKIRFEFQGIRGEVVDWVGKRLYDHGWKVFGLFNFPNGEPLPENTARCPIAASLIREHIPHHRAAGFSVLAPGAKIKPHVGEKGEFLRIHLGLEIPEGDCAIRVGNETRKWESGKVLVFDDRVEHEAWNLTEIPRAILIIDFIPPELVG